MVCVRADVRSKWSPRVHSWSVEKTDGHSNKYTINLHVNFISVWSFIFNYPKTTGLAVSYRRTSCAFRVPGVCFTFTFTPKLHLLHGGHYAKKKMLRGMIKISRDMWEEIFNLLSYQKWFHVEKNHFVLT